MVRMENGKLGAEADGKAKGSLVYAADTTSWVRWIKTSDVVGCRGWMEKMKNAVND